MHAPLPLVVLVLAVNPPPTTHPHPPSLPPFWHVQTAARMTGMDEVASQTVLTSPSRGIRPEGDFNLNCFFGSPDAFLAFCATARVPPMWEERREVRFIYYIVCVRV